MDLRDSVVVVTGASSGIGKATAWQLASRGAKLVVAARREVRLKKLAENIAAEGGRALPVAVDVTSLEDLERLRDETLRTYERVDVLVNNAGVPGPGPLAKASIEDIDRCIDVNFVSVVHATKVFLPAFLDQKQGHLVNVASLAGRYATPSVSVYSATKHAVVAFSESLKPGARAIHVEAGTRGPRHRHRDRAGHRSRVQHSSMGGRGTSSVPRWAATGQAFRVLTLPLYRWAMSTATRRFGDTTAD